MRNETGVDEINLFNNEIGIIENSSCEVLIRYVNYYFHSFGWDQKRILVYWYDIEFINNASLYHEIK